MIDQLEPRRMLSAGDLDPTFGTRGISNAGGTVGADGSFVAFSRSSNGLIKFNADGTRDLTFGDGGVAPTGLTTSSDLAVVRDGATGRTAVIAQSTQAPALLTVEMFDSTGNLDRSFDGDAVAAIHGSFDIVVHGAFDTSGNLYVAAKEFPDSGHWTGPVIFKFTPGGLDSQFGDQGGVDFDEPMTSITSLVPHGGKLVFLADYTLFSWDADGVVNVESAMRIERLNADGSQDLTFAIDPRLTNTYENARIQGYKLAGTSDNQLVLLDLEDQGDLGFHSYVYRFDQNGAQLNRFEWTNVETEVDFDFVVQSDGKIVTFSDDLNDQYNPAFSFLKRFNTDGTRDLRYGVQGLALVPNGSGLQIDGQDRVLLYVSNAMERIEGGPGRLRAVPGNAVLDQGVLDVAGTDAADVLALSSDATKIVVSINGHTSSFAASSVQAIEVRAGDGNDSVTIGSGVPGTFVFGGDGNDTLRGGDGNDTLTGGGGRDLILGGAGNDRLNGNGGNDTLSGDSGNDRVYGGIGNDSLYGGSGTDRLYGEAGDDYLKGDNGADRLDGGDGVNHATADDADALISIIA